MPPAGIELLRAVRVERGVALRTLRVLTGPVEHVERNLVRAVVGVRDVHARNGRSVVIGQTARHGIDGHGEAVLQRGGSAHGKVGGAGSAVRLIGGLICGRLVRIARLAGRSHGRAIHRVVDGGGVHALRGDNHRHGNDVERQSDNGQRLAALLTAQNADQPHNANHRADKRQDERPVVDDRHKRRQHRDCAQHNADNRRNRQRLLL